MEKTAIEYLIEQFESYDSYQIKLFHDEINTAKEMEKQQIIDFAENYVLKCITCSYDGEAVPLKDLVTFYKETFKQD